MTESKTFSVGPVQVAVSQHGPFERIALQIQTPTGISDLSAHRIGDTLVDAAGTLTVPGLVAALQSRPPERILCTHQHEDHMGGVEALREAFGHMPVHIERRYVPLVRDFDTIPEFRAQYFGHPRPVPDALGFDVGEASFDVNTPQGTVTLQTLETPGHTPYHVTYVARVAGRVYALTGDLYTKREPIPGWLESSIPCLIRSCRQLAEYGDALYMLPTHGKPRPDGARKLLELADWAERQAEAVHAARERVGSDDYQAIGREAFGDGDAVYRAHSEGQYSFANFVRSVLDPVLELPATIA